MGVDHQEMLGALIEDSMRLDYVEGAVSVVEPGYSTGWRTLPFTVVAQWQRGSVRLEIQGQPTTVVEDGGLVLVATGAQHRVTPLAKNTVICRWAHVQATIFGGQDLVPLLELASVHSAQQGEQIGAICEVLANEPAWNTDLVVLARRKALAASLLVALASLAPADHRGFEAVQRSERIAPVLKYLHEHWAEPICRDQLAARAGLSASRFHVVFHQATGMAPLAYLRRIRMSHAQRLLATTDLAVAEIGRRIGFEDAFHFSRQFRSDHRLSPLQYRQRIREEGLGGSIRPLSS